LEQAKLSDTEYRNLEDRNYSEALYGTFQTQPYWEEFGYEARREQAARTAEARAEAEIDANANANAADRPAAANTAANDQGGNTVAGTVVSVSSNLGTTPETQSEQGVRVRVRTESGTIRTVHLVTNEGAQPPELTLNRGDKVVITGEPRDFRGHKVLTAREILKDGKAVKF